MENTTAAPVANPFSKIYTASGGAWASTGSQFYNSNRAGYAAAVMSNIPVATFDMPPPLTQFGYVKVATLPSATDGTVASVGVGSIHPDGAPYGYAVWADKDGRFCIGKYGEPAAQSGTASPGNYLAATSTGVVTAGRYIAFLRVGVYFQGFVFSNTGVIVANTTLAVLMDGSFDGAFATGPGVFAHRTQDARLTNFYGLG
jgi:hypothetical protein